MYVTDCTVYLSAFSGEKVIQIDNYEGIAPNHYINTSDPPTKEGVSGQVKVNVISNDGENARVSVPDGQVLTVPSKIVRIEGLTVDGHIKCPKCDFYKLPEGDCPC